MFPLRTESGCHSYSIMCYMKWYIYVLQVGLHLVAVLVNLCKNRKELYTEEETIHKTIQTQNTQNRKEIY